MMTTAISTAKFIDTIGVNTHLDFMSHGYENVEVVIDSLNYLGVNHVRDSAAYASDVDLWSYVAQEAGVKFMNFMPTSGPDWMMQALDYVPALAARGILSYLEGANEEDMDYAVERGNTLQIAAEFQKDVYAMGQQLGL